MTLIFHSQNGHVGALFTSQTSQGAPLVPCFERLLSEIAGLLGHAGERSPDVVAALLGSDFSFQLVLYLGRPSVFSSFTVGCGAFHESNFSAKEGCQRQNEHVCKEANV